MSDKFTKFIDRVLSHEGGYVNHPKDPGGETNGALPSALRWPTATRRPCAI